MRRKKKWSSSSSLEDVYPSMFHKVYLEDQSFQQLKIPSAFVKRLNDIVPPMSVLLCSGKRTWSVDVEKVENTLCFQGGWNAFVTDSSLTCGEFLVFSYLSAAKFSVKIYEQSGCEKINAYAVKCKIETEDEEAVVPCDEQTNQCEDEVDESAYEEPLSSEEEPSYSEEEPSYSEEEPSYSEDSSTSEENKKKRSRKKKNTQVKKRRLVFSIQHDDEMKDWADEEPISCQDSEISQETQKTKSGKPRKIRVKTKFRGAVSKDKFKVLNATASKDRAPHVPHTSAYPHFTIGVLPVYIVHGSLNVPMPFARGHLRPGKFKTALQASGKSWPVTLTTYTNGCCKISSGWLAFVRDNNIKECDTCLFELVDSSAFTFKVSVFPY